MPTIIGKVYTKPMKLKNTNTGKTFTLPGKSYNVIQIGIAGGHKIYVTDQFNKPGVPQVVPDYFVKKYVPK
jgi:hypothetical protein